MWTRGRACGHDRQVAACALSENAAAECQEIPNGGCPCKTMPAQKWVSLSLPLSLPSIRRIIRTLFGCCLASAQCNTLNDSFRKLINFPHPIDSFHRSCVDAPRRKRQTRRHTPFGVMRRSQDRRGAVVPLNLHGEVDDPICHNASDQRY